MRPASPMVRRKRDFFEWEFTKKMNAVGRLSSSDGIHFVAISPFEKISPRSTITMELAGRLPRFTLTMGLAGRLQNKRPLLKKIKRSKIFAKKELAPFFTGRPSEEGVVFRGIQSLF